MEVQKKLNEKLSLGQNFDLFDPLYLQQIKKCMHLL